MTPHIDTASRYEDITETTGTPVTSEAIEMMYSRYVFAASHASGKRVLELGCGAGQGLGLLEHAGAQSIIGGDYSRQLLRMAHNHYRERILAIRLSAERLPLRTGSVDLLLFFEATYYVPDMERAFDEIARVLAPRAMALFVNANPGRPDFIRSPHSTHYHTAAEFRRSLERRGFAVTVQGAYPIVGRNNTVGGRLIGKGWQLARRALQTLHLVPRTLQGRARLKRLLFGPLRTVPAELPAEVSLHLPAGLLHSLDEQNSGAFKVLYVTARRD